MRFDPAMVEVWRHLLESVAGEMGATLERTGFSPNIKERRDYSCALFDASGALLSQAAHIPVHLGAMPAMMDRLRHSVPWPAGVMWLCNDPASGGTHLPDLTLVAPVYAEGQLIGFVACRAHHADIGGLSPGSLPLSTELFHEGLIIPPVRLLTGGRVSADVLALICANSRTPAERRGDIAAQVAANRVGAQRLHELARRHGIAELQRRGTETQVCAEDTVRAALSGVPAGTYRFADLMDDDGAGNVDLPITVAATLDGGEVAFDFTGSALETGGSVNATLAVTRSACYYAVRCLVPDEIPTNAGTFTPVRVIAPEGTIVNARFPRAVAAGNVETSQRIVDVVLGALAQAFPERIPAASQGTMNNVTIGGIDPRRGRPYAYYETVCGGAGASRTRAGASALHTHMTNTLNTPIEALELHYPLRVTRYARRDGSGGAGTEPGGDGVVRTVQLLAPARVSLLTERRVHRPYGLAGGEPGASGENGVRMADGTETSLPAKFSGELPAGAAVSIRTPGGGGYGPPRGRPDKEKAPPTG